MLHFSRWKTVSIWFVVLLGVLFAAPNVIPEHVRNQLPGWLPSQPMTLWLDLRGGSHLLLEVDRESFIHDRIEILSDEVRTKLRDARIGYTGLSGAGTAVQVRIRDNADIDKAREALSDLTRPVATGIFGSGSVTEVAFSEPEPGLLRYTLTDDGIRYGLNSAARQSIEVVSRRVNEPGTADPVRHQHSSDRSLVQVPGLDDPQRHDDILGQNAKLTFAMVGTSMPVEEAQPGRPPPGSAVRHSIDVPTVY